MFVGFNFFIDTHPMILIFYSDLNCVGLRGGGGLVVMVVVGGNGRSGW